MLLRVCSLAVIFSLSETVWQVETLNANLMPFSLLFMNSSKMLHLLSLPILISLEQKGGSLSLNYHCCILGSIIWYASHTVLWSGNSPECKLIYTFSIMAFVCSAMLEYITCSWNRSPASHCLPSPCKKNKKWGRERSFAFLHSWFCFQSCLSPWQSPPLLTTSPLHNPGSNPEKGTHTRDTRDAAFKL